MQSASPRFCVLRLAAALTVIAAVLAAHLPTHPAYAAGSSSDTPQPTISLATVVRGGQSFQLVIHRSHAVDQKGTVVLLHGFPGSPVGEHGRESQRSQAASLVMAGYIVVQFNYVGSWANSGQFSWFGGVEDLEAVVRHLQSRDARSLGVDGSRIVLVGHSYGGWVALTAAMRNPNLRCVAGLAVADMGKTGQLMQADQVFHDRRIASYQQVLNATASPIRAASSNALANEMMAHATSWDLVNQVELLRPKQLLLVAAEKDTAVPKEKYYQPLLDALSRAGAPSVRAIVMDDADHNFSQHRSALDSLVLKWITAECKL